ncbi:MAG: ABC transporter ATP-binding protein [Oscillospiraceae bacterium]|nr:ABC transporter ATP-binding protein [Oscillospiraceae bacterium]
MLVTMNQVVKRYGTFTALDNLTFGLTKGETLGLLGPNGAGKSTTIKILTGLTSATSGEITLFGERASGRTRSNASKQRIGLVPQDFALYETLSARDNLEYFGQLYGVHGGELKKRVDETLNILGLSDVATKAPKKFSGGMKRRLNIGCAIIHKPELLILDEPTVGIDPQSRNHILAFVEKTAAEGTTVIYTSHYMEEVERVCSRVCIMDAGKTIADGTVDEIAKKSIFEDEFTVTVNEPSPAIPENIQKIAGIIRCSPIDNSNRTFTIISKRDSGNLARILEVLAPHTIVAVTTKKPNLEDAFLSLTGKALRDDG